eukprot:g22588.t1
MLLERTLEISRTALASETKEAARLLHGIEESDLVLCHRVHQDQEFAEVDERQTLHALHFLDGHQLLLRFRSAPALRPNCHRLPSGKNHGHVGLQNLGNTCYMNAAIQCLVHSPLLPEYFKSEYKFDVNLNTKFGMAGKLAVAFAELLRDIHNARETGSGVVAPRDFKRIFSDFKPQFAGWKQQEKTEITPLEAIGTGEDSQEFLSMFLAGLSEDVNRTTKKPYRELKDSEGRPDDEVALEYWQAHCLRERSAVAALFSGQFRSVLRCQKCGYTNHSFEAFSFLPIPIPEHEYRWVTCMVVSASRPPAQHITRAGNPKWEKLGWSASDFEVWMLKRQTQDPSEVIELDCRAVPVDCSLSASNWHLAKKVTGVFSTVRLTLVKNAMETQLLSRLRGPALAPEDLDSIAASIRSSPTVRLALAGVKAFGRQGRWQESLSFLDSLHECHLQRHLYCYSAVMSCLEEPGKWQQSLALLCEFPSLAVQPDDMAFNAAIRACQGEWVQAFQLLELMRAQQLQPTAITFTACANAAAAAASWPAALAALDEARNLQLQMDVILFSTVLKSLPGEAWTRALHLLQDLRRYGTAHRILLKKLASTHLKSSLPEMQLLL